MYMYIYIYMYIHSMYVSIHIYIYIYIYIYIVKAALKGLSQRVMFLPTTMLHCGTHSSLSSSCFAMPPQAPCVSANHHAPMWHTLFCFAMLPQASCVSANHHAPLWHSLLCLPTSSLRFAMFPGPLHFS